LTLLSVADQFSLSAYDAAYLDLAIRLSLPLANLDDDLAKAARKASVPLLLKS
jgi:predicted nucleic acid-binding protein